MEEWNFIINIANKVNIALAAKHPLSVRSSAWTGQDRKSEMGAHLTEKHSLVVDEDRQTNVSV